MRISPDPAQGSLVPTLEARLASPNPTPRAFAEEKLIPATRTRPDQSAEQAGGMISGGRAASSQAGAISLGAARLPRELISSVAELCSIDRAGGAVAMECLAWIRARPALLLGRLDTGSTCQRPVPFDVVC
jgi:hypothetical protein